MRRITWRSRKGAATESNRDHGGFFEGAWTVLALVDASPKGERGEALAREWCGVLVSIGKDMGDRATEHVVNVHLQRHHSALRTEFVGHTASYAMAVIGPSGHGWAMVCGDCRVGYATEGGTNWFTPVHTAANVTDDAFLTEHAANPNRHCLTRHWNAKRFLPPAWVEIDCGETELLIASDGYWLEECGDVQCANGMPVQDDSSALRWQKHGQGVVLDSDAANFVILGGESA